MFSSCISTARRSCVMASSSSQRFTSWSVMSSRSLVAITHPNSSVVVAGVLSSSSVEILRLRSYVTRAHPQPASLVPVTHALDEIMRDAKRRAAVRQRKFERNEEKRKKASEVVDGAGQAVCSHPDETMEIILNLNLDPRKPGQSLRGSVSLPNGTGKKLACIVFTQDEELCNQALEAGALAAGGQTLIDAVLQRGETMTNNASDDEMTVNLDTLDRALATADIMPILSKQVARILGPRGLMPNAKNGTLITEPSDLIETLKTQIAGKDVLYRTEKAGVVHVPVGKVSFGAEKLLENVGQVMKEIYAAKPEQYGKGKKKSSSNKKGTGKGTKYLLSAYMSSTQGPGIKLDLRTLDPNSAFFLTSAETTPKGDDAAAADKANISSEAQAA